MILLRNDLMIPLLILASFVVSYIFIFEKKYYQWITSHWTLKRSIANKFSSFFFILGLSLLSIVVLDPREREIKVPTPVKVSKTIILIDTSTSMLTEDVRPNRMERAALLAKHFARRAGNHQISVMIFADITKKLVPFTSDRDLIDARIDSIKEIRNLNAGTSVEKAVAEAARMFNIKDRAVSGNILVITDGEDHGGPVNIELSDNIKIAFLGVGTAEGGSIPLKDTRGMFYGYKKDKAVTVISRLDKKYFERAINSKKNRKYFEATITGIPSEEIYNFFQSEEGESREEEGVIRPLGLKKIAYPALILLLVSYVLKFFKPFVYTLLLVYSFNSFASKGSPDIEKRIELLRKGELSKEEKINLADAMSSGGMGEAALEIYKENLDKSKISSFPYSYFNWGTSLLEQGDLASALEKYHEIDEYLEVSPNTELSEKIKENIKTALSQKNDSKDKNKDKNKEQKDKEQNDKNKDASQGEGQKEDGDQGQGEEKDNGEQSDTGEENSDNSSNPYDPQNGDSERNDDKPEKENESVKGNKQELPKDSAESGDDAKEKRSVPLLEQLKQDDRKLQLKLLDTSTQDNQSTKRKDW